MNDLEKQRQQDLDQAKILRENADLPETTPEARQELLDSARKLEERAMGEWREDEPRSTIVLGAIIMLILLTLVVVALAYLRVI